MTKTKFRIDQHSKPHSFRKSLRNLSQITTWKHPRGLPGRSLEFPRAQLGTSGLPEAPVSQNSRILTDFQTPSWGPKFIFSQPKKRSKIAFASRHVSEALRDRFWTSKLVVLRSIFGRMLMQNCATPKPAKMTPLPNENLIFHNLSF